MANTCRYIIESSIPFKCISIFTRFMDIVLPMNSPQRAQCLFKNYSRHSFWYRGNWASLAWAPWARKATKSFTGADCFNLIEWSKLGEIPDIANLTSAKPFELQSLPSTPLNPSFKTIQLDPHWATHLWSMPALPQWVYTLIYTLCTCSTCSICLWTLSQPQSKTLSRVEVSLSAQGDLPRSDCPTAQGKRACLVFCWTQCSEEAWS